MADSVLSGKGKNNHANEETYTVGSYTLELSYCRDVKTTKELNVKLKLTDKTTFKEFSDIIPTNVFSSKFHESKKMLQRFFTHADHYFFSIEKQPNALNLYFRVSMEDVTLKDIAINLPCTRELTEIEQLRLEVANLKEVCFAQLAARTSEIEEWKQRMTLAMERSQKMERYFLEMHTNWYPGARLLAKGPMLIQISGNNLECTLETIAPGSDGSGNQDLTPFYKLKRLELQGITTIEAINECVEELVLRKSPTLVSLKGIEKMPNLKTLSFDECPQLNPKHLFEISHQITTFYARACPTILEMKDILKSKGIKYKPFV